MFKQRLLTTLFLVPMVLLLIYQAPNWLQVAVVLVIMVMLAAEWTKLIPLTTVGAKSAFILSSVVLIFPCMMFDFSWFSVVFIGWLAILAAVVTYPRTSNYWGTQGVVMVVALILLPSLAVALQAILTMVNGSNLLIYGFCLIWATDIGAYLVGKRWGRHKLIPAVSPGKTYEGAAGGMALALSVMGVGYYFFQPHHAFLWFVMGVGTVLFAMLGDLLISMFKRRCHLKDTGHFFPGHGGVLDRLDSMIAALPFFYVMLKIV